MSRLTFQKRGRMTVELPYGQTQLATGEYGELIDSSEVSSHLQANGVGDPAEQAQRFIDCVPELLLWLDRHGREYPWRCTTDPWRIYATEILLQRTRADAVEDIYESFFTAFPKPAAVLNTDKQSIHDSVKSLGFGNQRTRSIREAARLCVNEHGGEVPADLQELQKPWRVGPYSARACLLFAFHRPLALVDANIARILERVYGYEMPTQPHKSDRVYRFAGTLIPDDPGIARAFNFSLLDLGAMICTENRPRCTACPLSSCCLFAQQQ